MCYFKKIFGTVLTLGKKGPKKCGDCCYAEMFVHSTQNKDDTRLKETWICKKDGNPVEIHPRTEACRDWNLTYKAELVDSRP